MQRHNRHVLLLRERLKPLGIIVKPELLEKLLRKINWDVDLALTALTMRPRPSWLIDDIGPAVDDPKS